MVLAAGMWSVSFYLYCSASCPGCLKTPSVMRRCHLYCTSGIEIYFLAASWLWYAELQFVYVEGDLFAELGLFVFISLGIWLPKGLRLSISVWNYFFQNDS